MTSRAFTAILEAYDRGAYPRARKWLWRGLYDVLSLAWRDEWRFMNYGFVDPEHAMTLRPEDEPDRQFIGLYEQAVRGLPVRSSRVLEIGSGRGGGCRFVARYGEPLSVTGVDLSPATVRRARRLNRDVPNLSFRVGDAERLPLPDGSIDVAINIESSHCYADIDAFAREVARVLAPGGWFTFADMRSRSAVADLDRQLAVPGLELVASRDLTPGVVAALDAADARKRGMVDRAPVLRRFMEEFSGMKGSVLYKSLAGGRVAYVARRYRKVASA